MRVICPAVLALSLAVASLASASTVFTVPANNGITLTDAVNVNPEVLDIRGSTLVDVGSPGVLGTLSLFDSTGGTDPDALTLPFGNNVLFLVSGNESAALILDFASLEGGTLLKIPATITGIGTITRPDLLAAVAASQVVLGFHQTGSVIIGGPRGVFLNTFALDSITSVPEPATVALSGAGIGALVLARRRKRAA